SLAQSLLRYRGVGASLAHDVVILTLSPRADLWREVNTLRALAGWRSYRVMPRFVLDDGLKLVPSPYDPPSAVHAGNPSGLGAPATASNGGRSPPSSRGTVSRASTSLTRSSPHPPSASTAATTGRTTARAPTPWSPVSSGTHSPRRRRWPAVPPGREDRMLFHDAPFLWLLLATCVAYWGVLRTRRARNLLLLGASVVFYTRWSAPLVLLVVATALYDYRMALAIEAAPTARGRRARLVAAVVVPLGLLAYFK